MHLRSVIGRRGTDVRARQVSRNHPCDYLARLTLRVLPFPLTGGISHRPSLLKYHNRHLRLGDPTSAVSTSPITPRTPGTPLAAQGWQLTALASTSDEEKLELEMEIERLEAVLDNHVGHWESRLAQINKELSGKDTSPV